ncbi:MAG: cytochrome c oxidase subunit II [Polyangiaceae bacterium]
MSQGTTQNPSTQTPGGAAAPAADAPQEAPLQIHEEGVWLPQQTSTFAPNVDSAFHFHVWISVVFFVIVVAPMFYFAVKYKRKSEDERTSPIDHHLRLEIFWTLVPTVLLIYMFWLGFKTYADAQVAPNDAYEIKVTAQMYSWTFEYPDGTVTNDLAIPKDRPVKLIMSSKDVLHAFFVPELRVKQDVVPNLYTTVWFQATKETDTALECAEYCGDGHSVMMTHVMVMPSGESDKQGTFENWLQNGGMKTVLPPPALGKKRYEQLCSSCHSTDGTKKVGPSFKGLWGKTETLSDGSTVLVDENYVKQSVLNPQSQIVKGFEGVNMSTFPYLKDRDIEGIIAFLKEQK